MTNLSFLPPAAFHQLWDYFKVNSRHFITSSVNILIFSVCPKKKKTTGLYLKT